MGVGYKVFEVSFCAIQSLRYQSDRIVVLLYIYVTGGVTKYIIQSGERFVKYFMYFHKKA
jgi:hypothetical protein